MACDNALSAAQDYMRSFAEPQPTFSPSPLLPFSPSPSLLLAGHQPELFHPGVWIKNFALARLAREHGTVPLSLIIDSDTARSPHLAAHGLATPFRPSADRCSL